MGKWLGAWLLAVVLLSACSDSDSGSSSGSNSSTNPTLRLANTIPGVALTLNAVGGSDSATFTTGSVATGAVSPYVSSTAQTYTVGVSAEPATLTAATHTIGMTADVDYTILAFARSGSVNTFQLTDSFTAPVSGFSMLAIANAGNDAGSLDVYLVAPGATINGISPQFSAVATRSTTTGRTLAAGTYDIVVTAVGKPGDVRLSLPAVTLASTKVTVLALTTATGGGLVNGVLVEQGGAIALRPTNRARVRVAGAFPPNGSTNHTVSVTIGSTSLGTLTAPSAGTYRLISGDTSNYSVSVNGVIVPALPAANFVNGGDYTIVVGGNPGAPTVSVLADDNQPSSSGFAHLRMINAAVEGGLTLYHNFLPIHVDVPYGTASAYEPASPSSTSLIQITSPAAAFAGYSASNVNIAGSGVYTIFVLGSMTAPVVSLSKDR